jgi:hypothetical protein
MSRQSSQIDYREVHEHLADLLGMDPDSAKVEFNPELGSVEVDMLLDFDGLVFVAEIKQKGDAASVGQALRHAVKAAKAHGRSALPLIVVPYMGQVGQELCEEAGACWLDLSGNASLHGRPGLRIQIEGKPNRFKSPGRPQNLFAPKSSRIARCLLMAPEQAVTQRELALQSGLDEGFTSRIIRSMQAQDLVVRNEAGAVKAANPELMLEAWREAYHFDKHRIVKGHIAARSGTEVLKAVAEAMDKKGLTYAATGLAGAWLLDQFAGFRLTVVYYEGDIENSLEHLHFREESRGANVWIVRPNDNGVFHGSSLRGGIRCVHPVQAYIDLKQQPERAEEASEALLQNLFTADRIN